MPLVPGNSEIPRNLEVTPTVRSALPFDLVIFDLDGTLADSATDICTAMVYSLRTVVGLTKFSPAELRPFVGKPLVTVFSTLLPPSQQSYVEECVLTYRAYYLENCTRTSVVFPGMFDLLTRLREAGYPLAIATTKRILLAMKLSDSLGLTPYFDLIHGVDDIPPKPDPTLLRLVLSAFKVPPERAIMIGDTDNDVLAARNAGVASCAVTWGIWSAEEMAPLHPDYTCHKLEDLAAILKV